MNCKAFYFSFLLAFLCVSTHVRANADSLITAANEAYALEDYSAALAIYDTLAVGHTSTDLFYNKGNCYFKLGDIPRAILNYERALRLSPGDEDVLYNLNLARDQIVDRITGNAAFSLGSTWGKIRAGSDPDQWARRSLWAVLLFFVLLAAAFVVKKRSFKHVLFTFGGITFVFTLIAILFAARRSHELNDRSSAIIITPKVDVRSEPRDGATVLFVLHKGSKVGVVKEMNEWLEVSLPNGTVGWMQSDMLERI